MKKRVLSLVLTLCMLLGLLPTAAFAAPAAEPEAPAVTAEAVEPVPETPPDEAGEAAELYAAAPGFTLKLTGQPYYHDGGKNKGNWGPQTKGLGAYSSPGYIKVDGHTISAKERQRFRNAEYLLHPFTVTMNVPAYTTRTVTFDARLWIDRGSRGSEWFWLELLKGEHPNSGKTYNTNNSTTRSPDSVGRVLYTNDDGGSATFSVTLAFENNTGTAKDISQTMTYFVGVSRIASILNAWHHRAESSIALTYESHTDTKHLTFDANGGSLSILAQGFSGSSTSLPTPTRTGYTFKSWKDESGKTWTGAYNADHGAKLTAQWAKADYTVTFDSNGGPAGTVKTKTVCYGEPYGELPTLTREGYRFLGWAFLSNYDISRKATADTTVDKDFDHTLYAGWFHIRYSVSFNAQGGTASQTYRSLYYGDPLGDLPTATRTGYTFDGWYTAPSGGDRIEATQSVTADVTYYAHWTPNTCTVTYNANGGTVSTASGTQTFGTNYSGLPTPTRTGYDFKGWYTAPSGGTKVDGNTAVTKTSAHTLYAQWRRIVLTLEFDKNGGTTTHTSMLVYHGDKLTSLPTATRPGYTFDGWYTAADGGTKLDGSQSVTASATYYARWTPVKVQLNYNANGGVLSGGSTDRVTYDMAYGGLPGDPDVGGAPTRTGYTFTGWADAPSGGNEVTAATVCTTTEPITIYAQWTANGVTVHYDVNGGSAVDPASKTVTFDAAYGTLPTVTRTGYTLAGWFTAAVGGAQVTADTVVKTTAEHTIHAQWTAKTTTVVYRWNLNSSDTSTYEETTCTYDQPYVLPADPERTGYTFLGWFTASRGGEQITPGTIFRQADGLNGIAYAHWRKDSVTVTLNVNGGASLSDNVKTVKYGQTYGEAWGGSLPTPTKAQVGTETYTFTGWYDAQTGGDLVSSATVMTQEVDHTLTAHWATTHAHTVGGAVGETTFTPLTSLGGELTAGNYYLDNNFTEANGNAVTTPIKITSGTVNLCLNGHTLDADGGIQVQSGATLNICDCKGSGKVWGHTTVWGSANLYGGTFDSTSGKTSFNKSVEVGDNTTAGNLTVDGATIIGGANTGYGIELVSGAATIESGSVSGYQGISVASHGELNIKGGTVKQNGGTYAIKNFGALNMTGGTVHSGNVGINMGNSVTATATITGGTVEGGAYGISCPYNVSVNVGGNAVVRSTGTGDSYAGITADNGTVTISGNAVVEGYKGVSAGGASKLIVEGTPTITGTTGDGITVAAGASLTMTGGTVNAHSMNKYAVLLAEGSTEDTTASSIKNATLNCYSGVFVGRNRVLTMEDTNVTANAVGLNLYGEVTATGCTVTAGSSAVWSYSNSRLVGGTYRTTGSNCVMHNGIEKQLTVDGATLISESTNPSAAALSVVNGAVTVKGSSALSGHIGASVAAGTTLNVEGGSITATTGNGITVAAARGDIAAGTLTMTGGSVTSKVNGIETNGTVTVKGTATVSGVQRGIRATAGTVNIEGGTVEATGTTDSPMALDMGGADTAANISGGTLTGQYGAVVWAGTLNVTNGSITGTGNGGIENHSTLSVTGGTVTGHQGGILVNGGAMLNMESGTVTGTGTGAPGISNKGAATVTGGTVISGPSASGIGNEGTLTVTGGTVNGSYFGLYEGTNSTGMTLGGKPTLQSTAGDIGLSSGKTITLSTETPLEADAKYSVALYGEGNSPAEGSPVNITGTNTADESEHFTAFDPAQGVQNSDGNVVQLYIPHKHSVGGGQAPVEWEPLPANSNDIVDGKHYYLTGDTVRNLPLNKNISLCLNGYTMTQPSDVQTIIVMENHTLDLCDCSVDKTGAVKQTGSKVAVAVQSGGTFNQYGGIISTIMPSPVATSGTWNFYGGKLAVNAGTPTILPRGQLNVLGNMGAVQFELTDETKSVHIGAKPNAPYAVTSTVYPVTVADGLPSDAVVGDYFTSVNDKLALVAAEGKATLRTFHITVDGGDVLSADATGKLTEAQLTAAQGANVGHTFDGFFTAATEGTQVTADTVYTGDTTIYPRWTECDHAANTAEKTTVASTCTVKGSESFICSVCGLGVNNELDLAEHAFDETWIHDDDNHWHACTVCGAEKEGSKAAHAWNEGSVTTEATQTAQGVRTYTCADCALTRTEAIPMLPVTYSVTFQGGDHTTGTAPTQADTAEGGAFDLPATCGLARTGYTLAGWTEDGGETLTGTYTMPAHDVTLTAAWTRIPDYKLQPGETIVLEDGTSITNDSDKTVTVTQPGGTDAEGNPVPGGTTVITLPDGTTGGVTVTSGDGKDKVVVPSGSTVVTTPGSGAEGPTITVGGGKDGTETGKVDGSGTVEAPVGSTVTQGDGTVTTITGENGGVITGNGNISFPADRDENGDPVENTGGGSVTVTTPGTPAVTTNVNVDGRGEGLDTETGHAPDYDLSEDKLQLTPGGPVITLPVDPDTGKVADVTDNGDGSVTLPVGSQIELPDGSTVTLDDTTGTVDPEGNVTIPAGGTATITDDKGHQTTVKVPEGGSGTIQNNGDVTLPDGGTVTVEDGAGGHTTITAPDGGGTVIKTPDGNLTAPEGSTITTHPAVGEETTVTVPEGGQTVTPGSNHGITTELAPGESKTIPHEGTVTNNTDGTVTITDLHGNETTVTIPGGGNISVDSKTGEVTLPAGSTVKTGETGETITAPSGGTVAPGGHVTGNPVKVGETTVTVTDPADGKLTADKDGNITVPGGATATYDKDSDGAPDATVTTPAGGDATVKPDGTTELPKGGTITQGETTVTVPESGGTVGKDESGNTTVPAGSEVKTGEGPTVTLPNGGTVDESGNVTGSPVTVGGTTVTVTAPEGGAVTTDPIGETTIPGGSTAEVEKGGTTTTVTVPEGGDNATVDPTTGETTVPGGTTVQTGDGAQITVGPGNGGTVNDKGEVTVPGGGSVTIPDGNGGTTTVTVPAGDTPGTVKPTTDGGVTAPGGSQVTKPDGSTETVPAQGGTVAPGGTVTPGETTVTPGDGKLEDGETVTTGDGSTVKREGDTVTVTDGEGTTTTVTLPTGTGDVDVNEQTGEVTLPDGSKIQTAPSGPEITVPSGGTVAPGGTITGDPVKVGDTTVTVTDPANGDVTTTPGGETTIPGGSTAEVEKGGTTTTVTVPEGGDNATVDPTTGETTVPDGTKVQTGETGTEITVGPGNGGTVDPTTGDVTVPGGGSVTIPDGNGGTTTVTVPEGDTPGTVKPTTDGGVEAPGGSTVTKPDGSTETVPTQGGTVKPDGTVTDGGDTPTPPTPGHTHAVSVGCETDSGERVTFHALTSDADHKLYIDGVKQDILSTESGDPYYALSNGSYYLADNVTLSYGYDQVFYIEIDGAVDLCLNGRTLDLGGCNIVSQEYGNELKLCDCGGAGVITSAYPCFTESNAVVEVRNGPFTMYGGTVKNTAAESPYQHKYYRALSCYRCQPSLYAGTVISDSDAAVYMADDHRLGGHVTITGADDAADIDWRDGTFVLTEPLTNTKPYRVTTWGRATLTSGWTTQMGDADLSDYFTCVSPGWFLEKDAGELKFKAYAITTQPTADDPTVAVNNDAGAAYQWYTVTADGALGEAVDGQTAATLTATAAGDYKCVISWPNGTELTSEAVTVEAATPEHTHSYGDWSHDETGHWHECTAADCPDENKGKKDEADHAYTDAADATCDVCGYERTLTPPQPDVFTVTFDAMGGEPAPKDQTVAEGETVAEPDAPTKEGYTFKGWFTDRTGATAYDFASPVTASITLYAQWEKDAPETFTVTFDAMGGVPVPEGQSVEAGKLIAKPAAPTQEGFTFQGWFTQATGGTAWQFNTDTVTEDITLYAQWEEAKPSTPVTPETPVELPGGGSVAKDPDTGNVTITTGGEGGSTTTVTPGEGDVTVDDDGNVTVPVGSQVTTPGGTTVELPEGGKVDGEGNITLPDGGSATIPGGEGGTGTTITAPDGGGTLTTNPDDGTVTVPGGSTVKPGENGPEITVPGGSTVDPSTGDVTVPGGSTVTIPDGQGGKTEVTVPTDGGGQSVTTTDDGKVEVPDGSTVKPGNGTELTVPGGSTVDPTTGDVNVPGNSDVTLDDGQGNQTTVTTPADGGDVKPTDDGKVEVPDGSTVKPGNGTEITVPGGSTVDPGTGDVNVPGNSDVTLDDGQGNQTTVTTPADGGDVKPTDDGKVEVPDGSTVKPGNGTEITVPGGSTVDPSTGGVTVPGGSTVTIPDGSDGKTEITVPAEGDQTVASTEDGVQVPQGSTVTTEDGTTLTVTEGTGTVAPDGTVTLPEGGKVTIEKDGETTTVTVAPGGSVGPDYTEPTPPTPSRPSGISRPSTYAPSIQQPGHGKVTVSPVRPQKGDTVTVTVTPDEGCEVDTVTVTDRNGKPVEVTRNADGTFTFTQPEGRVTVSATVKEAVCAKDETCPAAPFADLDLAQWYHDGIHFCVERELMVGTSETTFEPATPTSRAMVATILWRLQGSPAADYAMEYGDVAEGTWYTEAVRWATGEGIVKGYGNGAFGPDDPITREQLAAMLWRYAKAVGRDVSVGEDTNILSYVDVKEAGEWAIPAIQWAAGSGVMTGKSGGVLDPQGRATRAEAAAMLQRFCAAGEK